MKKKEDNDNKKKIYLVVDKYGEIQWVTEDESQAYQACGYRNGRFLRAQEDIPSAVHTMQYSVKTYPIEEFKRRKKLFWFIIAYFDKYPTKTGFPYSICEVKKHMIIDYEIDDLVDMTENYTDHLYFTAPLKITKNELWQMAHNKLEKYLKENNKGQ